MQHLVSNINFEVDIVERGQMCIGSEMIAYEYFGLLWGGAVCAKYKQKYISWIFRR